MAQTPFLEDLETGTEGATAFLSNGKNFNIVSLESGQTFYIHQDPVGLLGFNGTNVDARYITNYGYVSYAVPAHFQVATADGSSFSLKSLWMLLADDTLNNQATGNLTITGMLGSTTVFSVSANSGWNTDSDINGGYSPFDMTSYGGSDNSNKVIDRFIITGDVNINFINLDAITWVEANTTPSFVNGPAYTLPITVCQNSNGVDIKPYLHVSDVDGAQTLTVSVMVSPDRCGEVVVTDGSAASGSTDITPSGTIVYTPAVAFTGTEHFTMKVSDGVTSDTINVAVNVDAVTASVSSQTNVSCFGGANGEATIAVSGPSSTLTYDWLPGSPAGDGTASVTDLTAGVYTVTASDGTGCEVTQEVTITEPAVLNATASVQTAVSCNGGTNGVAGVVVTGGTTPYSYSWSIPSTATTTLGGLSAGTYSVMISDANACTDTDVVVFVDPTLLTVTLSGQTNVLCNAGTTGTATVDASGGTGTLTYSWSPAGGTLATATGLSAGDYTVTVTDSNNCTQTVSATITEPTALTASISATTNLTCNGSGNGSATVDATGGTTPYSYSWTGSASTTSTATDLTAGDYTVTVTDNNGCQQVAATTLTEPAALTATASVNSNVTCNGAADGVASVTASGGTAPYTYSWSGSAGTTETVTNLAPGSYTVTVTDANSCTATSDITITEPATLTANIAAPSNVTCFGSNNGEAVVTAVGGTTPYTYSWSGGAGTTATASALTAGNYTVTVTDNNGCTQTANTTITQPDGLVANISSTTDVSCNSLGDGAAEVTVSGGTTPYSYSWTGSTSTTSTATNLTAGGYTVTVTDNNGCQQTATTTINEPAALTATISSTTDALCNGQANGQAVVTAAGGTVPYTYSWTGGAGTAATGTGMAAGDYTVTVTDAHSCTQTAIATVGEPTPVTAAITSSTSVSCHGGNNGEAVVTPGGGTVPYTYSWTGGAGTAQTGTGMIAGDYTVTVTDNNGCQGADAVTITEPATLTASISASTDATCSGVNDGSAEVTAAGGTAPYTYSWTGGAGISATATGLAVGDYTVTVTDANSCTQTAVATISTPVAITANITSTTDVSCFGLNDGAAEVTVSGGTTPYSYSWTGSTSTTSTATDLTAGGYTVTVTDNNGCQQTATTTINEPAALTATISSTTDALCNGQANGQAVVTAAGGTVPYTYSWTGGAGTAATGTGMAAGDYTVTVTDAHSCTQTAIATVGEPTPVTAAITSSTSVSCHGGNNGEAVVTPGGGTVPYTYSWTGGAGTAQTGTGMIAGDYTVTVTDNNGCQGADAVTITEPATLTASISASTDATCSGVNDGSAEVTAAGGTAPYTYSWTGGAGISATATGLAVGDYTVTVTDANSCTQTAVATISTPVAITANITSTTDVSCFGLNDGAAEVTVSGGTTPYSYSWTGSTSTTSTATDLTAGGYTVTVTDNNGCQQTATTTINEPAALTATISSTTDALCNGQANGQAVVTAAGGTVPYTYSWTGGAGTAATGTGMAAGDYTVTVTDAHSCTQTAIATVGEPTPVTAAITSSTSVSCHGGNNGEAVVTPGGGTAPYTYSWTGGAGTAQTGTGMIAGDYTVTVTDNNGCQGADMVTISEPATLTASITASTDVSCNGGNNGQAVVTAGGGTAPYTYSWSPAGGTTATGAAMTAGDYTVTVTDANTCQSTAVVTIGEPATLTASVTSTTDVTCFGGNNGQAVATAGGGTAPYTYSWSPAGGTASTATNLTAGDYTVTVTDVNLCTQTAFVVIGQPATYPVIAAIGNNGPVCSGTTLSLSGSATDGTAPYSFSWAGPDGFTSTDANPTILTAPVTASGVYTLTVTDANNCVATADTMSVLVKDLPVITAAGSDGPVCAGVNLNLNVSATAAGVIDYSWSGSDGFTSTEQNPVVNTTAMSGAYTYTVVATGNGGCNAQAVFTATVNPIPDVIVPGSMAVCNGASTTLVAFTGSVTGTTFDWTNNDTTIGLTASGTGDIAAFTAVNTGVDPVVATISVTPTANTCVGATQTLTITVNPTPQLSSVLTPAAVCDSTLFTYSAASLTTGTSFVWSRDVVAGISNPANADNTDPAEYLDNTTAGPVAVTYVYTLTANGCTNTQSVVVTVNPTPMLSTASNAGAVCDSSLFSYVPASLTAGTTFAWSRATVTGISNASATGTDDPMEYLDNTTPDPVSVMYTYTLSANGCSHIQDVTMTVNPTPMLSTTLAPLAICDSALFSYAPASLTAGTAFAWSRATVTGIANAAAAGAGDPLEHLYNTTAAPVAVTYIYTLTANGCSNVQSVTETVNPTPKLSSTLSPAAICDNSVFSYSPTSATAGTTFAWTRASVSGVTNTSGAGTGNPAENLDNNVATRVRVTYIYTLSANGCTHIQPVTVNVNPTPMLSGSTVATICSGTLFSYDPGSVTPTTSFAWSRAAVSGISNPALSSTDSIRETLINTTLSPKTVVYHYTLTAYGCSSGQNVLVTVNPAPGTPVITISSPESLCSNTMYQNFGTTPAPDSVQYTWSAVGATVFAQGAGHQYSLVNFTTPGEAMVILSAHADGVACLAADTFRVNVSSSVAANGEVYYVHDHFIYTDNTVDSYQWGYDDAITLDSTILSGQVDQNLYMTTPDFSAKKYWVMTAKGGCSNKVYYNAPVGVTNVNTADVVSMNLFPNPATENVYVEVNGGNGNGTVELVDLTGKLISRVELGNHKAVISVSDLASGVYMVTTYANGVKVATGKLVKE